MADGEAERCVAAERQENERLSQIAAELVAQIEAATLRSRQLEAQLRGARPLFASDNLPATAAAATTAATADEPTTLFMLPEDRTRPTVVAPERVYRGRVFAVHVFVPLRWRLARGVGLQEIVAAASMATVCREDTLKPVAACPQCHHTPLVEVFAGTRESIGPTLVDGGADPLERYVFDSCQSRCTSSREHLHTCVLLCFRFNDTEDPVYSAPFSLMSRLCPSSTTTTAAAAAHTPTTVVSPGAPATPPQQPLVEVHPAIAVFEVRLSSQSTDDFLAQLKAAMTDVPGVIDVQILPAIDEPLRVLALVSGDCADATATALQRAKDFLTLHRLTICGTYSFF